LDVAATSNFDQTGFGWKKNASGAGYTGTSFFWHDTTTLAV